MSAQSRAHAPYTRRLAADLVLAVVLCTTGVLALTWLDGGARTTALGVLGFALPIVLVCVPLGLRAARRTPARGAERLVLDATATLPAAALGVSAGRQLHHLATMGSSAASFGALLGDACTALVLLAPVGLLCWAVAAAWSRRLTSVRKAGAVLLAATVVSVMTGLAGTATASSSTAISPAAVDTSCLTGGTVDKSFNVSAIDVDIPLNRFGDHDPHGKMYVLDERIAAVRAQEKSREVTPGLRDDAIQPLVIRANEGDCVEISFTNRATGGDFGTHIDGLEFAATSSGDSVGSNPSSQVASGAATTYRFSVPSDPRMEGAHYLHPGPGYRAAVDHGLFGTLMVEPPGSTYWNASTPRQPLLSGWEAIIKPAGPAVACDPSSRTATCAFREAALLHHEIGNDNEQITDKAGNLVPLVDDVTGSYRPGSFALNYRSEPFRNRLLAFPKEKSHAYSSYTFGEPATPIVRGYLSDPTKLRIIHVGAEKFHVFHLHGGGDRWRFNPVADTTFNYAQTGLKKDPETTMSPSQRLDSQSLGPGESFNLEIEGGAGGVQQSAGDFLYHCHIAKHYTSGMWGLWRVYDTKQPDLAPLLDRAGPPTAVDSRGLVGRTFNGVTLTKKNLDDWIRPQLPPSGIPGSKQDPTVMDWKTLDTTTGPLYLNAPADPTVFADSPRGVAGQPNLLKVDAGHLQGARPTILFNPVNGRPAYPLLRTHIGQRPPFTGSGHTGAPWLGADADRSARSATDPYAGRRDGLCPAGRKLRTFNVVAIGKAIKRTPTVTDPDGKIFVLAHDKATVLGDPDKGDPLAIRANQGDCVAVTLTNEIPDASAFDKFSKTSMHIHHVQFDVQGSDGVSAGFAYEHSVRPYTVTDPKLVGAVAAGATTVKLSDVSKLVGKDANGNVTHPWIAVGEGTESIDIHQVESVNVTAKTVLLRTPLTSAHPDGQSTGTEFIQYRWYPDVQLDNVFWHDHVDGLHGWGHGLVGQLIVEPAGSTYHDPKTGAVVDSGTLVDIHTSTPLSPGLVDGSFRELALWTVNDNDKGDFSTLNLKANPLTDRLDKANQFSSYKYGDPMTPLPRLYANDPLVVRTINVSPTVDTLHVQGGRTLIEPRSTQPDATGTPRPVGTIVDAVHYGVSEKYSLILNGDGPLMRMRPGDYLYANGIENRTQQGAWGIVRILPGMVDDLRTLPGVDTPSGSYTQPTQTGAAPPAATSTDDPCPAAAPRRHFALTALDRSNGTSGGRTGFVPNGDVAAVQARTKQMEPLVLHAVAGECVQVDLTNSLTTPVGFSVGKVERAETSGGVNVGFSSDQNTAPNATRRYVFYVPSERIGTAAITSLDGTGPMKQGLYGALVVAPASKVADLPTEFSDPVTGRPKDVGGQVLVHAPGQDPEDYRDFTVTMADDDPNIGQDFMPYPTSAVAGRSNISYRAAPVGDGPSSFQSAGQVPAMTSFAGDPVQVHVLMAPGSENTHVFGLGGLTWPRDPREPDSTLVTAQGMGPWETYDAVVQGGAGGTAEQPGDYVYGDLRRPFTAVGMWGLQKVLDPAATTTCPVRRVDGSTC